MDVILLYCGHQYVSATHVAIFRVVLLYDVKLGLLIQERTFRVFEKRVLRKIMRLKTDEVTGDRRTT
jgi:hypothetical protein